MKVTATTISGVLVIEPEVRTDVRGFFMETWRRDRFAACGIDHDFVQDNHSRSAEGTLRGLHYQVVEPQGKLVRVTAGEIFDVAVDLRRSSDSFGRWTGMRLSAENRRSLWIPPGFAHGFYVTSGPAEVQYKSTAYYAPEHDRCIRWDDAALAIDWPLSGPLLLSDRDRHHGQPFAQAECYA